MLEFLEFIEDTELHDPSLVGGLFTWVKTVNSSLIYELTDLFSLLNGMIFGVLESRKSSILEDILKFEKLLKTGTLQIPN